MASKSRTFVKQIGDGTHTRIVTNAAAEVAALFDGYHEETPAPPAKAADDKADTPATTSGGAKPPTGGRASS